MAKKAAEASVTLRPHVKTHKTKEIAELQLAGAGPGQRAIVVSTVAEAEFFAATVDNILYAVPVEPFKLPRLAALAARITLHVLVDSVDAVALLQTHPLPDGAPWSVFVKVDAGYARAGAAGPDDVVAVVQAVHDGPLTAFQGIYSHSGNSYNCPGTPAEARAAAAAIAERECATMAALVPQLAAAGLSPKHVSVGATPSVCAAAAFEGCTEIHPGNYPFFDRQQAASGSCSLDDVACFVLTRVVGRYPKRGELLVDAGGLALHKDQAGVQGWGVVVGHPDMEIFSLSQEVGIVRPRAGAAPLDLEAFPLGTPLRILPNHACMTAAMHAKYYVVGDDDSSVVDEWLPCKGW